mgnify:CR=1 FL=1
MQIPKDGIPDMEQIGELARVGLPQHYTLTSVRCSYGSDWPDFLPDDFEIVIEYQNHLDETLRGTMEDIEAYQRWAHALVQDIRGEWPPDSIRITFQERDRR